jgi:hypothetical protein
VTDAIALLTARLRRVGLNLVGATTVAAYDERVAPVRRLAARVGAARGVLVVGNGGGDFWRAFRAAAAEHDGAGDDALDRFTRDTVDDALAGVPAVGRLFPFERDAPDFQALAELAGLGRPGLVGVLIHPEYGPWIALRAAVLLADAPTLPQPAAGFDPCPGCVERPCVAACPAGAVAPAGWDVPACAAHRLAAAAHCAAACSARVECVHGRAHRYPADALAFHQAAARRAMALYAIPARKV